MRARVNGAEIYFDIEGMGLAPVGPAMVERPACFVLHGGPGLDHSYFKPWLTPLTEVMQLVYVDHRGTGRSERVPLETCTIEQMADDLEALRALLGLGKVVVLGNSFGGFLAQVYALRHPESILKLILVTTSDSHEFYAAATEELHKRGTPEQIATAPALFDGTVTTEEEFARWWDVMMPLYFAHWDDKRGSEMVSRIIGNPLVAAYMFATIIPHYDVRQGLPTIRVPTLVVSGREDWVTPVGESEKIANAIPGAELVIFEQSGHMPFIEEQAGFIDAVKRFIG
jgi:proline iminopeptidase